MGRKENQLVFEMVGKLSKERIVMKIGNVSKIYIFVLYFG